MNDLFASGEPLPIPLDAQLACVDREIKQRDRVYPRLVSENKMTQQFANDQIAAMKAVRRTLQGLADAAALDAQILRQERETRFTLAVGLPSNPEQQGTP